MKRLEDEFEEVNKILPKGYFAKKFIPLIVRLNYQINIYQKKKNGKNPLFKGEPLVVIHPPSSVKIGPCIDIYDRSLYKLFKGYGKKRKYPVNMR